MDLLSSIGADRKATIFCCHVSTTASPYNIRRPSFCTNYSILKKSGIKLACWMTEDPYYFDKTIQVINRFDYIFTIDTGSLKHYQSVHSNAYHLLLGKDPTIFKPRLVEHAYKSDLLLVGYPYPTRVNFIHFLKKNTNYQIALIGTGWRNRLHNCSCIRMCSFTLSSCTFMTSTGFKFGFSIISLISAKAKPNCLSDITCCSFAISVSV